MRWADIAVGLQFHIFIWLRLYLHLAPDGEPVLWHHLGVYSERRRVNRFFQPVLPFRVSRYGILRLRSGLPTVLPGDISISTDVTDGFTVIAVFFGSESLLMHPDVN
jgi:hypothetical protein